MTAVNGGQPTADGPVGGGSTVTAVDDGRLVEHRIGPGGDIPPGEGRAYPVAGELVAVFRLTSGQLRAVSAVCPHAGGPLADGLIDAEVVVCPLHQHVFELATGCSRSGQPALRSYPVRQDPAGTVWVSAPAARASAPPAGGDGR
ncbi:Rieske (2Fe-2S) protein [Solwaraspora sp. WMMD792]|uniref:Rieske (2Fe-2S) protein n=1 Tax=Solwaraspora sp. WMMD792 TaxID=3016099 RepID=UPI00241721EC|nr:Rieske (2Fe-2S) protein [Solwaraspora sp. WMMD792]MDG4773883.1 Rieske (2Fe-2S) protein [Solwaraspora sp. WMMD792]